MIMDSLIADYRKPKFIDEKAIKKVMLKIQGSSKVTTSRSRTNTLRTSGTASGRRSKEKDRKREPPSPIVGKKMQEPLSKGSSYNLVEVQRSRTKTSLTGYAPLK